MVEIPIVPAFPRTMILRHLDDSIPPPTGYTSWDVWWRLVEKGEGVATFTSPGTIPRGSKCSLVFTRTGEDVATIGMHFAHVDGTNVIDFAPDDQVTVEGFLTTLWAALKGAYDPSIALDRFIWHDWGVGVRRPNPATRDANAGPHAGVNDADAQLPPQVATSVTFKTARRKTWGRVFLPATVVSNCVAGRLLDDYQTAVRDVFGALLDSCAGASLPAVIWSPRRDGGPLKYGKDNHAAMLDDPDTSSFAMTVDSVQVDDLFDVIESRRYDKPLTRLTHSVG